VITEELADKLQENAPQSDDAPSGRRAHEQRHDDRPEDVKALDNYDVRRAVLLRLFAAVRSRDRTDAEVLLMAKAIFALQDWEIPQLCAFLSWDADLDGVDYQDLEGVINGKLDALPPAEVAAVATMAAIETALHTLGQQHEVCLQLAQAYGIDVLAVRDKVAEDLERQEDDDDDHAGESFVEGAERIADEAAARREAEAPEGSADGEEITTEPRAYVGARVRMKKALGRASGKLRKISGREGVLLSNPQGDDWMFKADGGKEKARVSRDEFVVLQAEDAGDQAGGDQVETSDWPLPVAPKIDPAAAWPFPKASG
jgi:hypothetical protein